VLESAHFPNEGLIERTSMATLSLLPAATIFCFFAVPVFASSLSNCQLGSCNLTYAYINHLNPTEEQTVLQGAASFTVSGFEQYNGATLDYSGSAESVRGLLRADAQVECIACTGAISYAKPGADMIADWEENKGRAVINGSPDLLAGIRAYEVTWYLDGKVSAVDDPFISDVLNAELFNNNNTCCQPSSAEFHSSPRGAITLYLQAPDQTKPFNFLFGVSASALTDNSGLYPASGYAQFSMAFASLQAVNAQGNVIPGVSLELPDGALIGASGFIAPEPSSGLLVSVTVAGIVLWKRRRRRA
jgi:hypothetical protein